jgi:hypothetical protein
MEIGVVVLILVFSVALLALDTWIEACHEKK